MRRRDFIILLSGAAVGWPITSHAQHAKWPLTVRAEQRQRLARIGFLRVGPPPKAFIGGFQKGLQEQGLVEGKDFVFEYAIVKNWTQILKAATELVERKVDIIVASGTPSVLPARDAAGAIPVVFVATVDPVATGLVASLGHPGRNITGMTSISGDLTAKRLEIVKELFPNLTKVAILVREASPTAPQYLNESQTAAQKLGIRLQIFKEKNPKDLERIFVEAKGSDALVIGDDAEFTANRARIAKLALENRLPSISGLREMVEAGGLLAYGASFGELYRRAASHVRKILQGASPANIPVEQPQKFEFVLNMRTAKALGLVIPPLLLARADKVIE